MSTNEEMENRAEGEERDRWTGMFKHRTKNK